MSRRKPDSRENKRPLLLPSQQARAASAARGQQQQQRPNTVRRSYQQGDSTNQTQSTANGLQQQTDTTGAQHGAHTADAQYEAHTTNALHEAPATDVHHEAHIADAQEQTSRDSGQQQTNEWAAPYREARSSSANSPRAEASACCALPLGQGVRLIAQHPCGLYVLDKPEGVLSHPNKKAEIDRSLLTAPYSLEGEFFYNLYERSSTSTANTKRIDRASSPQMQASAATDTSLAKQAQASPITEATPSLAPQKLYLLHRLDSATSGLLLLADNEALANSVRAAFAEGGVRKTYLALCAAATGIRAGQKGRWSDRLQREHQGAGGKVVHVRTSGSGVSAVTDFACRATAPRNHAFALMELHPISGRTHQLRVHCAQHQLPIVGDAKYGDFRLNRAVAKETGFKRLFLHATALALDFVHEGNRIRLQFTSPQPTQFDALLRDAPDIRCATPTDTRNRAGNACRRDNCNQPQAGKRQNTNKRSSTASRPDAAKRSSAGSRQDTAKPSSKRGQHTTAGKRQGKKR